MRRVFRANYANNGNNNNNSNRSRASTRSNGNNKLAGSKFVPSDDPPVLSGQPWNVIVVDTSIDIVSGAWSYFTYSDLYKCLLNQCGFYGSTKVSFECRFQSFSLWAAEENSEKGFVYTRLCVMINDLLKDNSVELTRLESNAMRNKFAKAGYHYPLTISAVPFKITEAATTVIASIQTSSKCNGILHLKVLWRGAIAGFKAGIYVERWFKFRPPSIGSDLERFEDPDLDDEIEEIIKE